MPIDKDEIIEKITVLKVAIRDLESLLLDEEEVNIEEVSHLPDPDSQD